jgi:hypothetical protein
MELLRNAGDFPSDRVVEYATIKISIPNGKLPNTLKMQDYGVNEDTPIDLCISPKGRLTRTEIVLESVSLAEQFMRHTTDQMIGRSYENDYSIELLVLTSTHTARITKRKAKDSLAVKEILKAMG